jgi:cell division protein FtsB
MTNHFEKRHGRQGIKLMIAEARISELEKQFEEYKKENQHLKNEIQKLTNKLVSSEIKYGINS